MSIHTTINLIFGKKANDEPIEFSATCVLEVSVAEANNRFASHGGFRTSCLLHHLDDCFAVGLSIRVDRINKRRYAVSRFLSF